MAGARVTLPLAPLRPYLPVENARSNRARVAGAPAALAALTGMTIRNAHRWLEEDRLPWYYADAAACALGLHPANLWGEDWINLEVSR